MNIMKITMVIGTWGNQVLAQIHSMDGQFKANDCTDLNSFEASNGFKICSGMRPAIQPGVLYLRGWDKDYDDEEISYSFPSPKKAKEYVVLAKEALDEWSTNWEGFKDDGSRQSSIPSNFITERDLGNIKYVVGQWEDTVLLQFLKLPTMSNRTWQFGQASHLNCFLISAAYKNEFGDYLIKIAKGWRNLNHSSLEFDFSLVRLEKRIFKCEDPREASNYINGLEYTLQQWSESLEKQNSRKLLNALEVFKV